MLLFIFIAIIVLTSAFDAQITKRRLDQYGVAIELNGLIGGLASKFGSSKAIAFGLIIPNVLAAALLAKFSLIGLSFFAGMRAAFFFVQVASLMLEKELKRKV